MCSVIDDPDESILASSEEAREEAEFRLLSGPVSGAETPPVSVTGLHRSIQKEAG